MTDKQPKALRLADAFGIPHWTGLPIALHVEAAAELRRLHEVNAELVEALGTVIRGVPNTWDGVQKAKIVLDKAKESNHG